jgi:hypothetical protein
LRRAFTHFRQRAWRHFEQFAEFRIPLSLPMSNSSVRLALVQSVAKTFPPVSRWMRYVSIVSDNGLAPLLSFAAIVGLFSMSQRILTRKSRYQSSARSCATRLGLALLGESAADGIATPILPDQRVVQRLAGLAIKHQHGFALVRDADGGKLGKFLRLRLAILAMTARTFLQISSASCSTQPGCG